MGIQFKDQMQIGGFGGTAHTIFADELYGPILPKACQRQGRKLKAGERDFTLCLAPHITQFVLECFEELAPASFFHRPASRSGRYHPPISQGEGGLVRHTRLAAWWGSRNSRQFGNGNDVGPHHDVIVAALILHDVMKDGDPLRDEERGIKRNPDGSLNLNDQNTSEWNRTICGCHGVDMARAIWERVCKQKMTDEQKLITTGIAAHMGPWTTPEQYQPARIEEALPRHIAYVVAQSDYCAAQKDAEFQDQLLTTPVESVIAQPAS